MLRRLRVLFADAKPAAKGAAAAAPAAAGAGAGGAATTTKQKKKKWIDRRSHKVRHNGKEVFSVHDQPACALCHVRFRYREDYQAHKQSALHINREKWAEQEKWWAKVGEQAHRAGERDDDKAFGNFLRQRSVASGIDETTLAHSMRRAVVHMQPIHCTGADAPTVRGTIAEPRDQRWPYSPKW